MSQKEYLKIIERELSRINKIIDSKILRGEEYKKEAQNHKLLLKKIRFIQRKSFFQNFSKKLFNGQARFASFF
jgi:hypothetical protein